eukprot:413789_1
MENKTSGGGGDNDDDDDVESNSKCKMKDLNDKTETTGEASNSDLKYDKSNPNQMTKESTSKSTPSTSSSIKITSHRVSLDEPIMQHRHNWNNMVLPRLRSFVDAVYNIRGDDDKRYRLLRATALVSSGDLDDESDWWQIIHDECPWLKDCDTAYSRQGRNY